MPRVSICCSVLNQAIWFEEMLATVLAQTYSDFEFIIVDDGSTDDIAGIVAKANDPRIRFHRFEKNLGIPHGINWAFERAKGEYVQPIAADERLWAEKLALQVAYLDKHQNIAAVFGLPLEGKMGLRPEWEQYALKAQNRNRTQWLLTMLNLDSVPLGGCNALWRRTLFQDVGYFLPDLIVFTDHEWYCRVIEAHDIHVMPYRVAISLPNPDGVSTGNTNEKIEKSQVELALVRARHPVVTDVRDTKVTVAIPVKDMAQYIGHAIRSVQTQTHKDWEIIVVDDGSTDGTADVVKTFQNSLGGDAIRLVIFPENKGDREACNYALNMARSEYFMCLSADDLIEPDYMGKCVNIMRQNAHLEFIASQTDFINEAGTPYTEPHPFKTILKAANKPREEWKEQLRGGNVYFGAGMFRTKMLRDVGGWRQSYKCLSDYAMYQEVLTRGDIAIIEEDLTHTRIHAGNMSGKIDAKWLGDTYADIKERFYQPRRKLIIATPFYNCQGFSPYIASLVETIRVLGKVGIEFEYWNPSGDAYVQRVKNTILNQFLHTRDATDLLMVDSDMEWHVDGLLEMMMCEEDIIVGSYPQKNSWGLWSSRPKFEQNADGTAYATERKLPQGGTLIEGAELAGGFMLFKRAALEKYRDHFKDLIYIDPTSDPNNPERVYTEFFMAGRFQAPGDSVAKFWGEDRTFSMRMKEIGIRWWISTNITFGHWGINRWTGTLKTALDGMKSGAPAAKTAEEAGIPPGLTPHGSKPLAQLRKSA